MTKKILQGPRIIEFKFRDAPHFRMKGSYDVIKLTLEGDKVNFERCDIFNDSDLVISKTPSDSQWDEFLDNLNKLKIWNWKKNYRNQGAFGGSSWHLSILTTLHEIESRGDTEWPPNFNGFLKSINKLMRIEVFEIFDED